MKKSRTSRKSTGLLASLFVAPSPLEYSCNDFEYNVHDKHVVELDLSISSFRRRLVSATNDQQKRAKKESGDSTDQIMFGHLLVTNKTTDKTEDYDWTIYLDEITFEVQSPRNILLCQGEYEFKLFLTNGVQQYVGFLQSFNIKEGINRLSMDLKPVIGNKLVSNGSLEELGRIQFKYDKTDLSKPEDLQLGITINGNQETLLVPDHASDVIENYINLDHGEHLVDVRLYQEKESSGRSTKWQKTVNLHSDNKSNPVEILLN